LDKSDGRDKLLAAVQVKILTACRRKSNAMLSPAHRPNAHCPRLPPLQYAAMFVAAGEPGNVKKVQASVATARKVFRIMRVNPAAWALARNLCLTATCVKLLNAWSWHAIPFAFASRCYARASKTHAYASLQPLEVLNPILQNPGLGGKPLWAEVLLKLRPILMSIYFGADHVVWAQQVGAKTAAGRSRGSRRVQQELRAGDEICRHVENLPCP
jgi:hypothetical protein